MSTADSAGSVASRGEAARARTERANELRRNSRESRSPRAAEPEPEDGDTLPESIAVARGARYNPKIKLVAPLARYFMET